MTIDWSDTEFQRAFIQGGLTACGVVVGALASVGIWFLNRRSDRIRANELRDDRRDDLRKALYSDLLPLWSGIYLLGYADTKSRKVEEAFRAAEESRDDHYTP